MYPYETFGGGARPMIPKWSLVHDTVDTSGGRDSPVYNRPGIYDDGRAHLERRWNDPATRELIARDIAWIVDHNGGAERVVVLRYPDEAFVGKMLAELAKEMGGTFQDVVVHMALNGYPDMVGGARTRGYGIHDVDVVNYYRQEYTATASDAGVSGVAGTPFAAVAGRASASFRRLHPQDRALREGPEGDLAAVCGAFDDGAAGADYWSGGPGAGSRGVQGGPGDLRFGAAAGSGDGAGAGSVQRGGGLCDGEWGVYGGWGGVYG